MLDYDKIIATFDFKKPRLRRNEIRCSCPFAAELHAKGTDNSPSFGINLETGHWQCFVCSDQGTKGRDIVSLALKLRVTLPDSVVSPRSGGALAKVKKRADPVPQHLIPVLSANPEWAWEYLKDRGITIDAIRSAKVGRHKILKTIYFPDIDDRGVLRGWVERNENWSSRYKMGENCNRKELLFGLTGKMPTCYLTEGPTDKLKLDSFGFPAVATFGNMVFPEQADRIMTFVEKLVLVRDNDKAGEKWMKDAEKHFRGKLRTWVVQVSDVKDAGDPTYTQEHWLRDRQKHLFAF